MSGRGRVWKRPFWSYHSTYFAHTFNRCLESTFSAIYSGEWSHVDGSELWGLGFVSGSGRSSFCQMPGLKGSLSWPWHLCALHVSLGVLIWGAVSFHRVQAAPLSSPPSSSSMLPCYLCVRCWSPEQQWYYIQKSLVFWLINNSSLTSSTSAIPGKFRLNT